MDQYIEVVYAFCDSGVQADAMTTDEAPFLREIQFWSYIQWERSKGHQLNKQREARTKRKNTNWQRKKQIEKKRRNEILGLNNSVKERERNKQATKEKQLRKKRRETQ
jgi:hypothetical protein